MTFGRKRKSRSLFLDFFLYIKPIFHIFAIFPCFLPIFHITHGQNSEMDEAAFASELMAVLCRQSETEKVSDALRAVLLAGHFIFGVQVKELCSRFKVSRKVFYTAKANFISAKNFRGCLGLVDLARSLQASKQGWRQSPGLFLPWLLVKWLAMPMLLLMFIQLLFFVVSRTWVRHDARATIPRISTNFWHRLRVSNKATISEVDCRTRCRPPRFRSEVHWRWLWSLDHDGRS